MTAPAADPLQPDDRRMVGRYRLSGRLGQGGMGTVYLGMDEGGRPVAVKVINPELAEDDAFRTRFRREVTAARRVPPFCTAPVLDAELDVEPLYVVTEYVAGPDLARMVAETGPLVGSNVEALAVGVVTALGTIHEAGVVHRDLKPSNVLLSPLGPRVIDFGIARALDVLDGPTRTGQILGTPSYMAPELLRGEPVTSAYDIFAWGCLIVFAATGRSPFAGRSVPETMYRIVHQPPTVEGLDDRLRPIVLSCLDKDPACRPTAQQLIERLTGRRTDLAQAARSLSVRLDLPPAGPPPLGDTGRLGANNLPSRPASPPDGRRRRIVLLNLAGLAAVVVAAVVTVVALSSQPSPSSGKGRRSPASTTSAAGPGTASGPVTLLTDDFSDTSSGWPNSSSSPARLYSPQDRDYLIYSGHQDRALAAAPFHGTLPAAFRITVNGRFESGQDGRELGVWCWGSTGASDPDVRIELALDDHRNARIRKYQQDSGATMISSGTVPFRAGVYNTLQADCRYDGTRMTFALLVNGGPAITGSMDGVPPPYNGVGLMVTNPSGAAAETEASFGGFRLERLS